MGVNGVEGPEHFAEMVTLTNIPSYVNEIWFDFEYFESEKGERLSAWIRK